METVSPAVIKGWRRALFYGLIVAFFGIGTTVVLYAQGLRLDTMTLTIKEVGGIFVRSYPANARIFLDGEPIENKSGIFERGTLVGDLFPKRYTLVLKREGYHDWEQTVDVLPSLVTEAKHAVLVPKEPEVVLAAPIRNAWLREDEMLIEDENGALLLNGETLPGDTVVDWAPRSGEIVTFEKKSGAFFLTDPRSATSTSLTQAFRRLNLKTGTSTRLALDPENGSRILVEAPSSLALVELSRNRALALATTTPLETISRAAASGFWIAWATSNRETGTSTITLYDTFFGTKRAAGGAIQGPIAKLKWADANLFGFIDGERELFVYETGNGATRHLASDAVDVFFDPARKLVAVLEMKGLEVFSLKDEEDYWRFALPEHERITKLLWFNDGRHLFVGYPDRTMFLNIEDPKLENFVEVAPTDTIFYRAETNELHYLDGNTLKKIEFSD